MEKKKAYINKIKILSFIFIIILGGIMFVYAGIDDSPGGQLLGLIVSIIGIIKIIKN